MEKSIGCENRARTRPPDGKFTGLKRALTRSWNACTRPFLYHVIVHVTDRCNLRCKTCFVAFDRNDLSVEQAALLGRKLGYIPALDIGGGEPFLNKDLLEVVAQFRFGTVTIPTNGQLRKRVVPVVRALCEAYPKRVTIALSVDGLQETNDAIRGPGTFAKAMETYTELRQIPGLTLKVNTVITNRNLHEAVKMAEYVRGLKPDYHSLLLLRGEPLAPEEVELPAVDALREITPALLRIARSYNYGHKYNIVLRWLKGNYQEYMWNVQLRMLSERRAPFQCRAPWLNKVVYADGQTSMCELKPRLANLLEDDPAEVDLKLRDHLADFEREHGRCYCTHNCHMSENIAMHPASVVRVLTGFVH